MASSVSIPFPGNITVYVNPYVNAAYTQRLTITPPSGTAAVFTGSGEGNVSMGMTTQGFLSKGSGQPYFRTPSAGGTYTFAVTGNSKAEDVQFNSCTASWPGGARLQQVVIGAEDASDKDYNDTVVICSWYAPAT